MARIISLHLLCIMILALPQLVLASQTHVVRKSESLHSIARKYHVSVKELKNINNLTGTRIAKGARLMIPSHANAHGKNGKTAEKVRKYKVVKGDNLIRIAKKTGIKAAEIRRINGLRGNLVKAGQVLALNKISPVTDDTSHAVVAENRLQLVNRDLLNEQEFSNTLAELTDLNADHSVDLAKNLENNIPGVSNIKKSAYSFLGARYRFGGNSRTALDCSSFTQQVFREQKVSLPRTAREQFHVGSEVMRGDLQKGDLVFFQTYAQFPSHVGIYLGDRKMIHASSRDRRVVISTMDTPYYLARFLGARRIGSVSSEDIDFDELLSGVEEENELDVQANDTLGLSLNQ
ncbi:MAG: peptidoglycan-binding protein LysM [Geobacteraceae bacterium GWB2_52_12]|nr:MAG: peptidoglycan-binding protein LysM [Geobacteraceae bacterium GWB2_52_12]